MKKSDQKQYEKAWLKDKEQFVEWLLKNKDGEEE